MRVLHLPTQVGGNAWHLSRAERENNMESDVFYFSNDLFFKYQSDLDNTFLTDNKIIDFVKKIGFCKKITENYDVLHFNFGQTLFSSRRFAFLDLEDLLYYKKKGKVLAVTFQGDDIRQADYCIKNQEINYFGEIDKEERKERICFSKIQRRRIDKFSKYVDLMYATNPDLLSMLPEKAHFRPYTKIDINKYKPHFNNYDDLNHCLLVVHAPSNRNVKGTRYIEEAIKQLQTDGINIELKLVEGINNVEALKLYYQADIVIDQLLVGWYGGFAVECMAMGKPVMCYIRKEDLKYIPEEMRRELPIIEVDVNSLYTQLLYYVYHRSELLPVARKSRKFVEKWHDCNIIAQKIILDYQRVWREKNER